MLLRILLVASDRSAARRLARAIPPESGLVTAAGGRALWRHLGRQTCDVVVLRASELPELCAEFVREIRSLPDRPEVIVVADREDPAWRAELLGAGCLGVVAEALADANLGDTLGALLARRREAAVQQRLGEVGIRPFRLKDYASASPTMRHFLETARRVVGADSTLLLLGETGVGKEWLARAIHAEGPRAAGPFVAVNCGAIPEALLESELFGHERGAFTGAARSRRGHFELAHRGSIFLDEIADLPLHLQVKLLRVLEERRVVPIGSEKGIPVDVRVLAATNRDLEQEVRHKRFRADLFYRLNVVTLTLPPLRERREDIPELLQSYVDHFAALLRRPVKGVRPEAVAALQHYDWPGNVRELINAMERAVLMANAAEIGLEDLPLAIRQLAEPATVTKTGAWPAELPAVLGEDWSAQPWRDVRRAVLDVVEKRYLAELLVRHDGRLWEVAEYAGIDPRSLFEKMRRHGLHKEAFRAQRRSRPAASATREAS